MPTVAFAPYAVPQFLDNFGKPIAGGTLETYLAGTSTPAATYADNAGTVPNPTTIQLDSSGRPSNNGALVDVRLDVAKAYKFVLKDAAGVTVRTIDNIPGGAPAGSVSEDALADDAVSTRAIKDGAVTADKISDDEAEREAITGKLLFSQDETYAAGSVGAKLSEWVSVKDAPFNAKGDGVADDYDAINAAWTYCLANGKSLHFPAGTYLVAGDRNFPFRNEGPDLLDCKNITIFGDGPNSVLKTISSVGADVLQLNNIANLHIRNLRITAELTGFSGAGSNGISITGGFDNITIDQVWCESLPYVDKTTYLDGGKAFTIQPGTPTLECGSVTARVYAKGCVYGAGLEVDLVNWATKKHAIDVDVIAEDCYTGIIVSSGPASAALSPGMTSGFRARGLLINCQHSVTASRAHGVDIDAMIITNKSAADRRLSPSGTAWSSSSSTVTGLIATYAKNSRIRISGDLGECDYKAQIGGATAGASSLGGATDDCEIRLDIGGTAAVADIAAVDSGGNVMNNSILCVSTVTASSLPDAFYLPSRKNDLQPGAVNGGSFTATLTGVSGTVTGTVKYTIQDDMVVLEIPTITGTSNTTSATLTGVPAHLRPTTAQACTGVTTNGGTSLVSRIVVETGGSITLYSGVSNSFTASGTKGVQFSTISYRRS